MYNENDSGKHYIPAHHHCKANRKKKQCLIIAIVAILCSIIACATIAYVFTSTQPLENTFTDAYVACEVKEDFDGTTKSNVTIKNTGDVQSYIRAKVVVTWMSDDKSKVTAKKPVEGSDYVITYATGTNWQEGSDGYWYYKLPVDIGNETNVLIEDCSLKDGATVPDGYYLSVEIVASSIQSLPTKVILEQWNSGVSGVNGSTLIIK